MPVATPSPSASPQPDPTLSFDPSSLSSWIALTLSLLIALLGSSVLTTLITRRSETRATTKASRRTDARRSLKSLRRLRTVYLGCADGALSPDEADLADLANGLYISVTFTGSAELLKAAKTYVEVGELYAAQDPLTSTDDESERFFELLELLRRYLT